MVKTLEAVDQDKQGIRGIGFGQLVTARDAIWIQMQRRDFIKNVIFLAGLSIKWSHWYLYVGLYTKHLL